MSFKKSKVIGFISSILLLIINAPFVFADTTEESYFHLHPIASVAHVNSWDSYISTYRGFLSDAPREVGWFLTKIFFHINQAFADFMAWYISPAKGVFSILTNGDATNAASQNPFTLIFAIGTAVIFAGALISFAINALNQFTGRGRPVNELVMTVLKNLSMIVLTPYLIMFVLLLFQSLSSAVGFTNTTTADSNGFVTNIASQMIGNNLIDIEDANANNLPIYSTNPTNLNSSSHTDSNNKPLSLLSLQEYSTTDKNQNNQPILEPFRLIPLAQIGQGASNNSGLIGEVGGTLTNQVGVVGGVQPYKDPSSIDEIKINQIAGNGPYNDVAGGHGLTVNSIDWVDSANKNVGETNDLDADNLAAYTLNNSGNSTKKLDESNGRTNPFPGQKAGVYVWHVDWLPIIFGEVALMLVYIFALFKIAKIAWEFLNLLILGIPTGAVKIATEDGARFLLDETLEMSLSLIMTVIGINMFIGVSKIIGDLVSTWQATGVAENFLKTMLTPILLLMFAGFSREDPRFWRASGMLQGSSNAGMTTRGLIGSMAAMGAAKAAIRGTTSLGKNIVGGDFKQAIQRSKDSNGGKATISGTLANLRGVRGASFMAGKTSRMVNNGAAAQDNYLNTKRNLNGETGKLDKLKSIGVGAVAGLSTPLKDAGNSISDGLSNFGSEVAQNAGINKRSGGSKRITDRVNRINPNAKSQARAEYRKATPDQRKAIDAARQSVNAQQSVAQQQTVLKSLTPSDTQDDSDTRVNTEADKVTTARGNLSPEMQIEVNKEQERIDMIFNDAPPSKPEAPKPLRKNSQNIQKRRSVTPEPPKRLAKRVEIRQANKDRPKNEREKVNKKINKLIDR
jgi:hypothetical protein